MSEKVASHRFDSYDLPPTILPPTILPPTNLPPMRLPRGGSKILNIGFFMVQPKIMVVLVLGTTENLEFSLILQK